MTTTPRLSIGLPVYNGARYLADSIEALLAQTYLDFELIVADNASTDSTVEICEHYAALDQRIRYTRQPRNLGLTANHNFCLDHARGELFKWASYDDLYHPELLERCIDVLDTCPDAILAHSWTATIDSTGRRVSEPEYRLATSSPRAPERFRSCLFETAGGDDIYGIVRSEVLRRVQPQRSHHHADRSLVAELSLYGPFRQVPDWLYSRRVHPQQAEQAFRSVRSRCVNMDPRRADRLRHPLVRLYGEYIWAYVAAIWRAPLSARDRTQCYRDLLDWLASRARNDGGNQPSTARPAGLHPPMTGSQAS